jgi:hypothetical protein
MVSNILLHHDAITGTHKNVAYIDYMDKLELSKEIKNEFI